MKSMSPAVHPGRLLKRELGARALSANRLALDIGNRPQFWLDLQSQYDIAVIERDHGVEISRRVRPADAA
jgi:plasmid maintenance system antidote protein VapI